MSAMVCADNQSATSGPDSANGGTGWELALVPTPNSKDSAAASSKMVNIIFSIHILF